MRDPTRSIATLFLSAAIMLLLFLALAVAGCVGDLTQPAMEGEVPDQDVAAQAVQAYQYREHQAGYRSDSRYTPTPVGLTCRDDAEVRSTAPSPDSLFLRCPYGAAPEDTVEVFWTLPEWRGWFLREIRYRARTVNLAYGNVYDSTAWQVWSDVPVDPESGRPNADLIADDSVFYAQIPIDSLGGRVNHTEIQFVAYGCFHLLREEGEVCRDPERWGDLLEQAGHVVGFYVGEPPRVFGPPDPPPVIPPPVSGGGGSTTTTTTSSASHLLACSRWHRFSGGSGWVCTAGPVPTHMSFQVESTTATHNCSADLTLESVFVEYSLNSAGVRTRKNPPVGTTYDVFAEAGCAGAKTRLTMPLPPA